MCGFALSAAAAASFDSTYWAPPLDVQGTKIVNAKGYALQLKGFATMDPTSVTKAQVVNFRNNWNITLLRVPLLTNENSGSHCWVIGNIAVNATYLAAADSVLKWCRDNKIYVLFDGWHEGGQGNTVGNFSSTIAAWRILADRYKNQDHILWEIFNEPHNVSWTAWVPMAQQLIDTIRARNPVVKVVVAGTANWCQQADVKTLKINRDKIIYSWHPYQNVYGSIGATTWESRFGYIATTGVAPVMNTEWGFSTSADSAGYGTQLIQYMKDKAISWTGWIYSSNWGPAMLTSLNPEVRGPSGNLMFKACHDIPPVAIKAPIAGSVSEQAISINNSIIQFNCAEPSAVIASIYALNGQCVRKLIDQRFTKGSHSIRWNSDDGNGKGLAPGMYTVRLKIEDREYQAPMNILR